MKRSLIKNRLTNSVCCLAVLLLGLAAGTAQASTYWVTNGIGSEAGRNGSTSSPFFTISNAVKHCLGGDTVMVSNGTYTLTAIISVPSNITIQGASGNPADVIVDGNNAVSCFTLATNATLQYLTIQHGTNGSGGGGAFTVSGGTSVTVRACNIINNSISGGGGSAFRLLSANCLLTMDSCTLSSNLAGVTYNSVVGADSYLFTNCTFSYNCSSGAGGGIYLTPGLHLPTITTCAVYCCTFISNTNGSIAGGGGGPAINLSTNVVGLINNCAFIANRTTMDGGAISIYNGTVSNCGFTNNWARGGGALALPAGSALGVGATVISCSFISNSSATYGGGAVSYTDGIVSNCVFAGNFTAGSQAGGGRLPQRLALHPN